MKAKVNGQGTHMSQNYLQNSQEIPITPKPVAIRHPNSYLAELVIKDKQKNFFLKTGPMWPKRRRVRHFHTIASFNLSKGSLEMCTEILT